MFLKSSFFFETKEQTKPNYLTEFKGFNRTIWLKIFSFFSSSLHHSIWRRKKKQKYSLLSRNCMKTRSSSFGFGPPKTETKNQDSGFSRTKFSFRFCFTSLQHGFVCFLFVIEFWDTIWCCTVCFLHPPLCCIFWDTLHILNKTYLLILIKSRLHANDVKLCN